MIPKAPTIPRRSALWGAIHKRLADPLERRAEQRKADLDTAIFAYEKGYYLKDDYYNGVNLAFMLDTRAAKEQGDDRIADRVRAKRVHARLSRRLEQQSPSERQGDNRGSREEGYWMRATMAEVHAGLGNAAGAQEWMAKARAFASEPWMVATSESRSTSFVSYWKPRLD